MAQPDPALILASTSRTRRQILTNAGLTFDAVAPEVDEAVIRETLTAEDDGIDPADVAEVLARAKAEDVSARHPDALVIGADQVLACEGVIYSKVENEDQARDALLALRGRTHQLHTAVALAQGGETVWERVETAHLTMREFSAASLGSYIAQAGPDVLESVGCYKLEGPGVQLFEKIEGDYFTILGLPLLPLLAELRARKLISA
jgi:septum formation protein